jgi:hypothetical protein
VTASVRAGSPDEGLEMWDLERNAYSHGKLRILEGFSFNIFSEILGSNHSFIPMTHELIPLILFGSSLLCAHIHPKKEQLMFVNIGDNVVITR